ncbi:checkpoint HUS1 isoform X5, partial [Clarias magur]
MSESRDREEGQTVQLVKDTTSSDDLGLESSHDLERGYVFSEDEDSSPDAVEAETERNSSLCSSECSLSTRRQATTEESGDECTTAAIDMSKWLTCDERIEIVLISGERSNRVIAADFNARHPTRPPISHATVSKLLAK